MERFVSWFLVWLMERHNLCSKIQCGFSAWRFLVYHLVSMEKAEWEAFLQWQHLVAISFDLQNLTYHLMPKYSEDVAWMETQEQTFIPPTELPVTLDLQGVYVHNAHYLFTVQKNGVPQGVYSVSLSAVVFKGLQSVIHHLVQSSVLVDFHIWHQVAAIHSIEQQLQLTLNTIGQLHACMGSTSLVRHAMPFSHLQDLHSANGSN